MIRDPLIGSFGELTRMPRNATWVGLVLLAVAGLFWPDTVALGHYWFGENVNAQSGILIALLCGFLLFRARERFARITVEPVTWACLPFIACAAASLICWRAGILTLQLLFLPAILWFALLTVLGFGVARMAAFPIGFLYFAVPGWRLLAPALQRLTAWAVKIIGPIVGLPLTVSGTTLSLPGGVAFTIEPACSGIDFLTIGLAIAALYGELEHARFRRRSGLVGGMLVVAIISNWLRVLLILEIGYRSHMRSSLATSGHVALGWVVFACVLLLFVRAAGRAAASEPDAPVTGASTPERVTSVTTRKGHAAWRYGTVATALLAVPALVYGSLLATEARAGAALFELPAARAPWRGPARSADPLWQPGFVGAQLEQRARYQSGNGTAVEVVAIGFPTQSQGAQILNEGNSLLGNHGLVIERVRLVTGASIPHGEVVVRDPEGGRSVIWSVIDVGGRLFGEPLSSQLWYGARSLIGAPYTALFAVRAQCDGSCDVARSTLADFMRANGSALFASLPTTGSER